MLSVGKSTYRDAFCFLKLGGTHHTQTTSAAHGESNIAQQGLPKGTLILQAWNEIQTRGYLGSRKPPPPPTAPDAMEYGKSYLRATRPSDDDGISMLSTGGDATQYQAYHPDHRRQSSPEPSIPDRLSWTVSPVALQQSLPLPTPSSNESSTNMRPSIFGSRAVIDSPFQEPVAWANSTNFQQARESPKPEIWSTVQPIPGPNHPSESRRYFRHPRHILEPWSMGFWKRFPWFGFGALFGVLLCKLYYLLIDQSSNQRI